MPVQTGYFEDLLAVHDSVIFSGVVPVVESTADKLERLPYQIQVVP